MRNMSTKEELKKLIYDDIGNPYDKGCAKNCSDFWTRHKKCEDDFVVKDLRMKAKISEKKNDKENSVMTVSDILGIEKTNALKDNYKESLRADLKEYSENQYKQALEDLIDIL